LAVAGGFVAVEELEDVRVVSEAAGGDEGFDSGGGVGEVPFGGVVVAGRVSRSGRFGEALHFEFESGFLEAPDAHLPPLGGGHDFDLAVLGWSAGAEFTD
jgi:hypothetical protein